MHYLIWHGPLSLCASAHLNLLVPPDGGILLLLRQKKYPRKGDPCAAAPLARGSLVREVEGEGLGRSLLTKSISSEGFDLLLTYLPFYRASCAAPSAEPSGLDVRRLARVAGETSFRPAALGVAHEVQPPQGAR